MARKQRQPAQRKRAPARRGRRSNATAVLAPGVGQVASNAFGGRRGSDLRVWDAKLPYHLALPRAVGPYTTIRVTSTVTTGGAVCLFGTYRVPVSSTYSNAGDWSTYFGAHCINSALSVSSTSNTDIHAFDLMALGNAVTVCPSAFTVQVMNAQALQTTTGIVYGGVMSTQAEFHGDPRTWDNIGQTLVAFQNPRILAAAKLALRGVQVNSYPLSMSQISEFTPLHNAPTLTAGTWDNSMARPTGWAPIVFYNPNLVPLTYLVTTEWRVRFDLANPACASHIHHPVASDMTWDKLTRTASAMGNGVMDIADMVANVGNGVARMRRALGPASALPMLVD